MIVVIMILMIVFMVMIFVKFGLSVMMRIGLSVIFGIVFKMMRYGFKIWVSLFDYYNRVVRYVLRRVLSKKLRMVLFNVILMCVVRDLFVIFLIKSL